MTSKYAVINNETIRLYNDKDKVSHHPLLESVMEDVSITFNDNGSINLEGDEWQFDVCFHDEYPKYFDYEIHPDYIEKTRFRKRDIVRCGWHRKLENKHKIITMSHYKIIQESDVINVLKGYEQKRRNNQ